MHIHICIYICICIYIYTYIYGYICTYIHISHRSAVTSSELVENVGAHRWPPAGHVPKKKEKKKWQAVSEPM